MAKYIYQNAAIEIADYAADEHPYDKDPERPETYSDYNQGWNDACDYIRGKLENMPVADVAPVRHGHDTGRCRIFQCSECGYGVIDIYQEDEHNYPVGEFNYCPNCGAKMGGEHDG